MGPKPAASYPSARLLPGRAWPAPDFRAGAGTLPEPAPSLAKIDGTLGVAVVVLLLVIALFELTALDLAVQDLLFDFERSEWVVDPDWRAAWAIFHEGPTWLAVGIGLLLGHIVWRPARWRGRFASVRSLRRAALCALLTLVSVPLLIAAGKKATNMFCPSEVRRYGGDVCYVRLFESYPADDQPARRGSCFPAAHASGGFALVGLFGLFQRRRHQALALSAVFLLGWIAGGYQMVTGSHYLSHTLVTVCVTWIVFLGWRRMLGLAHVRGETRLPVEGVSACPADGNGAAGVAKPRSVVLSLSTTTR